MPERSSSGLSSSCTCDQHAIWTARDNTDCTAIWPAACSLRVCSVCPSDQIPSKDLSRCMSCGNSTLGINKLTNECKCPKNAVLREKSENGSYRSAKECIICAENTLPDDASNTCQACPDSTMVVIAVDGNYICTCPSNYLEVKSKFMNYQSCVWQVHIDLISAKLSLTTASTMSYSSFKADHNLDAFVSVTSALLDDVFLSAVSRCYFYQSERDMVFCQALGNLCVLQHFDPAVTACIAFDMIQRNGRVSTVNGINGWFSGLPFLNYRSEAPTVLQTTVTMQMSFDEMSNKGTTDHLNFVLASYHVNGSLIGFRSLTDELAYCQYSTRSNVIDSASWMRFGVNALMEYPCDLEALQSSELIFHELFIVDKSTDDKHYIPVPVRNLNYHDTNGLLVNKNSKLSDGANDFLSHRFFLYDAKSGIPVGKTLPEVIRFAETITLSITTQASDPKQIYVPLLSIKYSETTTPEAVSLTFRVSYTSDTDGFWSFTTALFTVVCVVGACRVLIQAFNWQRRINRNEILANVMCLWISALISNWISTFALISFSVMFALCGYCFIIYRLQSSTVFLVPEVDFDALSSGIDEYYSFRVVLPLAFFCQLVSVLRQVYRQSHLQLFFVDWEKPRATVIDIDSAKPTHAPISVWRMVLVVNEWNKLQTVRKTSLRFTIVFTLFLLYGCNLKALALPVPRAQVQYIEPSTEGSQLNPYLRFANVSVWWLITWSGQRLWKWMIYERYIDEPREELFIDLCTVAKVSCFFLDEQYHGFYLHCRSPHPFADGSMKELVDQLKQEEAGLTAGRYLDSTFPNCQIFELFVTRKWKQKFYNLYSAVRGDNLVNNGEGASGEGLIQRSFSPKSPTTFPDVKRRSNVATTEDMVQNAGQLSEFLQSFVENKIDRFRWRIYRAHTCVTRFLDTPPDMSFSKQSFFLPDTNSKFAKAALLLGLENELMLLDLLCFTTLDLWVGNHAISGLTTYSLHIALLAIRAHFGKRNIAKSSLVDSRFLI